MHGKISLEHEGGRTKHTKYTDLQETEARLSEAGPNNHMWKSGCSIYSVVNALKIRFNQVYTAASALKYGHIYRQGDDVPSTTQNGECPICRDLDSVPHILGLCKHPSMPARFIARHNNAVVMIYKAFSTGTKSVNPIHDHGCNQGKFSSFKGTSCGCVW